MNLSHWGGKPALALLFGLAVFTVAEPSQAGIAACGGIRLEDALNCEIKGELDCEVGCDELGIYKKACATKLHTVCREDCTLLAEPVCEDECTVACESDCDRGINVICIHNCFGECVGTCDAQCETSDDRTTCMASCEATCDGECDIQCAPVVDASCYQHCVECCNGSCGAKANMDCQTSCQEQEFETCEHEFRADCSGSCAGDGALFCDGEYVLSGSELGPCIKELIAQGIASVDLEGEVDGKLSSDAGGTAGCQLASGASAPHIGLLFSAIGAALLRRRRRKAIGGR